MLARSTRGEQIHSRHIGQLKNWVPWEWLALLDRREPVTLCDRLISLGTQLALPVSNVRRNPIIPDKPRDMGVCPAIVPREREKAWWLWCRTGILGAL